MLLLATLAATTAVHTCSSKSLLEVLQANLAIAVYAVVRTLVTAEVCACHMLVAGLVCLVHRAIGEVCASESQEIVDTVPTVVVGRMHTVHGHAVAEVCCFANYSEAQRTNALSANQGVVSVLQEVVEAGKSLCLLLAEVDQGMCFVASRGGIVHLLW